MIAPPTLARTTLVRVYGPRPWVSLPLPYGADKAAALAGLPVAEMRASSRGYLAAAVAGRVAVALGRVRDAQTRAVPDSRNDAHLSHLAAWLDDLADALARVPARTAVRVD